MSLSFRYLGGADEVGNAALELVLDGSRFLCEYGYAPSRPPRFPHAPTIEPDLVLVTHAHMDHAGLVPSLPGSTGAPVLATGPTRAMAELLCSDGLKVARSEGYTLPYGAADVERVQENFDIVGFGGNREVNGVDLRVRPAGHIPGAAMFELEGSCRVLFTGDINTADTHLVRGTRPHKCDVLFMESTYAGREHPDRRETERSFLERVEEVVERGGRALIPVFAVGRTQEVLMMLHRLRLDIWLDGMGQKVNRILLDEPGFLRDPGLLRRSEGGAKYVRGERLRAAAAEGEVIVTTGGMLEGGPVLEYLRLMKRDRSSAVFLTGYQVEGTNGRLLLEKKRIDLGEGPERVDCMVEFYDFSAHCGHSELVEFAKGCSPERVVLFHGDSRERLAEELERDFEVILPRNMEKIRLS